MKSNSDNQQDTGLDIETELLLEAIYRKYHYDFRAYARPPLERRLAQACAKFGCQTLTALQDRLLHDPMVFSALLDHLTIQFSEMFRDPSYFRSLRETVLPILRTYPSLKVWCPGCGSGEEAYSLAILFREEGLLLFRSRASIPLLWTLLRSALPYGLPGPWSQGDVALHKMGEPF